MIENNKTTTATTTAMTTTTTTAAATTTTTTTTPTTTLSLMPSPSDCSLCGRIGFAILGIVLGIGTGAVFACSYHNVHVAVWGFLSAAVAAVTLYMHVTHARERDVKSTSQLRVFMYFGCLAQVAAISGCAVYVALALYLHQGITLHGEGYALAAVWCLLTVTWGFQLFYFSRAYCRQLTGEAQPLLPSEKRPVVYRDIVCCSIQCSE
ncbi:heme transporter hrg1-A-like [Babylonia areolata]|uniref:heme transporter hrg1-A-like n=1 Tax=Babylonia areolata TaxID=304850 RepID=UPI003FD63E86